MGQKTSIYLTTADQERVQASGLPLVELIRYGLDTVEGRSVNTVSFTATAGAGGGGGGAGGLGAATIKGTSSCKHPAARVHKGLCGACGVHVDR